MLTYVYKISRETVTERLSVECDAIRFQMKNEIEINVERKKIDE